MSGGLCSSEARPWPHLYVRVLPMPHAHDSAVLCPGGHLKRILRESLSVDHQAVVPRRLEGVAQPLRSVRSTLGQRL